MSTFFASSQENRRFTHGQKTQKRWVEREDACRIASYRMNQLVVQPAMQGYATQELNPIYILQPQELSSHLTATNIDTQNTCTAKRANRKGEWEGKLPRTSGKYEITGMCVQHAHYVWWARKHVSPLSLHPAD